MQPYLSACSFSTCLVFVIFLRVAFCLCELILFSSILVVLIVVVTVIAEINKTLSFIVPCIVLFVLFIFASCFQFLCLYFFIYLFIFHQFFLFNFSSWMTGLQYFENSKIVLRWIFLILDLIKNQTFVILVCLYFCLDKTVTGSHDLIGLLYSFSKCFKYSVNNDRRLVNSKKKNFLG